jgi:hypothetical protein
VSYFLWNAPPDDALLGAARDGSLAEPAVLERHARRLLADARALEVLTRFHHEWLQLDRLEGATKDPVRFPTFAALKPQLLEEQARFTARARSEGRFSLVELLTSRRSVMTPELAAHYGLPAPGAGWQDAELPPERAGLLTLAGVLAAEAGEANTSVVLRGLLVRTRLLCQTVAPPPANVTTQGSTSADRLADAQCAGCHRLMDPIGQGLEAFDAAGAHRASAAGAPVDERGELSGAGEVSGPFTGAAQLAQKLGNSAAVQACYATQWFRFARGRRDTAGDACALERLQRAFDASGGDVTELLVAMVTSDTFTHGAAPAP